MRKKLLWMFFTIPLILSVLSANMIEVNAQETHDIAVTSVTPYPTLVKLGELVNITVVVKNDGTVDETFNATVYYDTTAIETKTDITLAAGANTSLTFTWNTTNTREEIYATTYKEKTYIMKATATITQDDDPTDNTLVSPSEVKVISQYIAVIPQSTVDTTLTLGKNYTISIKTDYNGSDVWCYEFTLTYNPNVLQGVNVTNGDLITTKKHGSAIFNAGKFNNTAGKLSLTMACFFTTKPVPLTSGPGTLANVTFKVVGEGDFNITLGRSIIEGITRLVGVEAGGLGDKYNIIDNITPNSGHILHGYFRNTAEPVIHDIAVTSVTPYPTSVVAGELVNITVVVENQGTMNVDVTVKVYYDYGQLLPEVRRIGTKTENLATGTNTSLTFTWNTTDVTAGDHTITAVASALPGETDIEDNTLQSNEIVTITAREEQPLSILLIIGIVVLVVVALMAVVYTVKGRKKPTPTPE